MPILAVSVFLLAWRFSQEDPTAKAMRGAEVDLRPDKSLVSIVAEWSLRWHNRVLCVGAAVAALWRILGVAGLDEFRDIGL